MDELLKPASIVRTTKTDTEISFLRESSVQAPSKTPEAISKPERSKTAATLEDALDILKHEPNYDSLISVLLFLSRHADHDSSIPTIKLPSPLSAQLVQVLVSEITPNYWTLLVEDVHQTKNSGLRLLLYCLSSITGVNAILVRLKALIQEAKSESTAKAKRPDIPLNLGILLDLLCRVLHGDGWLLEAYRVATSGEEGSVKVRLRTQEIVAALGSGRIMSLAIEAEDLVKASDTKQQATIWPADSLQYAQWLARNIVTFILSDLTPEESKIGSDLFAKALRLGHSGKVPRRHIMDYQG